MNNIFNFALIFARFIWNSGYWSSFKFVQRRKWRCESKFRNLCFEKATEISSLWPWPWSPLCKTSLRAASTCRSGTCTCCTSVLSRTLCTSSSPSTVQFSFSLSITSNQCKFRRESIIRNWRLWHFSCGCFSRKWDQSKSARSSWRTEWIWLWAQVSWI